MNPNDYFYELLENEPSYEAEGIFFEPFWNFMYRFQSAERHWQLNKSFIENHISILQSVEGDGSAEFDDLFSETVQFDIEYFPEHLRLSTSSFLLSLLENLLGDLSESVAEDLGIQVELENRKLPYINKHILWLTRSCGIEIAIDKETWKGLDAIREIRNRFVHRINRSIPSEIKKTISEMTSSATDGAETVTDDFVDIAFSEIAELAKTLELAYIDFYERVND